ncbi:MAG: AI-2E family transporter [Longimicrobiales bacterium]
MEVTRGIRHGRYVYAAAVLVVFAMFLYSVRSVLTPFLLLPALLLLLWPYAGTRGHLLLSLVTTLIGMVWVLESTGFLLAPFLLALVLAYIFNPLVRALERRRVPRVLAILLLALPGIGVLVLLVLVGLPALADQIENLIRQAPRAIEQAAAWVERARLRILTLDLPLVREEAVVEWLGAYDAARLEALLRERQEAIARRAWSAVLGLGRGVGAVLTILGYTVITPVLTYYLLRDYEGIKRRLAELMPRGRRDEWGVFLAEYDRLLSHFLRGQLLAAAAVGVLTFAGLWILDFPYAGVVGAVAGVFNLVPYLGLVVSLIPALVIALLSGAILLSLGKIAIVFAIVQFLDGSVIGPRIVGESVGLHPVWVMLAIAVGGFFFGFVGLLIAIPAAVLVKLLLREGLERYEASVLYRGEATGTAGPDAGSGPRVVT